MLPEAIHVQEDEAKETALFHLQAM
jgi:hypothetical protein